MKDENKEEEEWGGDDVKIKEEDVKEKKLKNENKEEEEDWGEEGKEW